MIVRIIIRIESPSEEVEVSTEQRTPSNAGTALDIGALNKAVRLAHAKAAATLQVP